MRVNGSRKGMPKGRMPIVPSFISDRITSSNIPEDLGYVPTIKEVKEASKIKTIRTMFPQNKPKRRTVRIDREINARISQARENELKAIQNAGLTPKGGKLPISNDNEELAQG